MLCESVNDDPLMKMVDDYRNCCGFYDGQSAAKKTKYKTIDAVCRAGVTGGASSAVLGAEVSNLRPLIQQLKFNPQSLRARMFPQSLRFLMCPQGSASDLPSTRTAPKPQHPTYGPTFEEKLSTTWVGIAQLATLAGTADQSRKNSFVLKVCLGPSAVAVCPVPPEFHGRRAVANRASVAHSHT